jgi:glycosyltransferase involved in cell wall biosynthesis
MLRGANIVCLSSIDWTFNWQNPQELAAAFADSDNRVLFIENTGVRRATIRDWRRLWARFRNWRGMRGRARKLDYGVEVYSPLLIPNPYSAAALAINARLLSRAVRRWLSGHADRPLVVVTFLPTPLAIELVRRLGPDFVAFYCIDRLADSSPGASPLREYEREMLAACDLVLLTAENLRSPSMANARVEMLPTGVRFDDFERARNSGARPPVFDRLQRPIAGFAGSVRSQTDIALIAGAVALAPEITFAFVGPVQTDVSALTKHPNVRFIDAVAHDDLIRILPHFDVGFAAYVQDRFTSGIMPAKLREYLAAGLPVVSTPLPEVCQFALQHPGVIDIAADAPSFVAALRNAIRNNNRAAVERRIEVARQYDFSDHIARTSDLIEEMMRAEPAADEVEVRAANIAGRR